MERERHNHEDDGKGARSRPFVVSPPGKDKASPASTVMPKPILKNKNSNHVRFDPEPREMEPRSPLPRSSPRDGRDRPRSDRAPSRHRDHRDREGSGHSHDDRRDDPRQDRAAKKKAWGEAFGAVGIGGAAASLLGALAEAAVGM